MSLSNVDLVILPFAASSSFSYQKLKGELSPFLSRVSIYELPGHGTRFEEPCMESAAEVKGDLMNWVQSLHLGPETVIFGHCLGAYLAVAVKKDLVRLNEHVQIICSGYLPSVSDQQELVRRLSSDRDSLFEVYVRNRLIDGAEIPDEMVDYVKDIIWADSRLLIDLACQNIVDPYYSFEDAVYWGAEDPLIELFGAKDIRSAQFVSGEHLYFMDCPLAILDILGGAPDQRRIA